ncbi:MAG: hypothetical protein JNK48_08135 [Bryobacterales bacterium]|nr:hypothetical protein [Bryobacterales bacterium]
MKERILLRFQHGGRPMQAVSFHANTGIAFDTPKDASPLNVAIGVQSLQPVRLDAVRKRHDWRNNEFKLDVVLEDGGLLLSGFKGDPDGLPAGPYDLTVEVESYRFRDPSPRVILRDGKQANVVFDAEVDTRDIALRGNFDKVTDKIVQASAVDGQPLAQWLTSKNPRAVRKACLLNILTKLAAPPMPKVKKGLAHRFQSFHFADVDRVYGIVDPALKEDLNGFVEKEGWVFEGRPKAAVHKKVISDAIARFPTDLAGKTEKDFRLESWRQGGRNCLQLVIALPLFPHSRAYAEADIDLGNPLWDLDGLFVHLGELLDPGRTDHFDVHKKLDKGETGDFVFYDIV